MAEWNTNIKWLLKNASPIIRYRIANELLGKRGKHLKQFQDELLVFPEVSKWFDYLVDAPCHGSEDKHLENVLAKLVEFGFSKEIVVFDEKVRFYIDNYFDNDGSDNRQFAFSLIPMLIRAGYWKEPKLKTVIKNELPLMIKTAKERRFDILLEDHEKQHIPLKWRDKPISRPNIYTPYIYSFYSAIQYAIHTGKYLDEIRMVLDWTLTKEIQSATGAYWYDEDKKYCYSGNKFCFPGFFGFDRKDFNPKRLFILLELVAGIPHANQIDWVSRCMAHLETFQINEGRYKFPTNYLPEGKGYYMYEGKHMGLGENRRKQNALEIESTFRIALIMKKLTGLVD